MNVTGKFKDSDEIEYIKYVMRLSGAREKEFVRAAVLYYSDYLMERANDLRQQEIERITAAQSAALEAEQNARLGDSDGREPGAVNGDSQESVVDETTDSNVLAQSGNNVVNS